MTSNMLMLMSSAFRRLHHIHTPWLHFRSTFHPKSEAQARFNRFVDVFVPFLFDNRHVGLFTIVHVHQGNAAAHAGKGILQLFD